MKMSAAEPKPARRRLRFTLRGLLFVVTVVALVFAWLNHHYRAAIDEAAFIAEFQAIILSTENARASRAERGLDPSLKVTYDYQWDADGNFLPNAEPRGPSFLRNWLGEHLFDRVHTIEIDTEDNSLSKPREHWKSQKSQTIAHRCDRERFKF